ncbi:hypothetical protein TB2_017167 [Malus domestica]
MPRPERLTPRCLSHRTSWARIRGISRWPRWFMMMLLGLEWSRRSKINGFSQFSASVNLAEERKMPKLTAESTWDLEM